jgi:hypothetical protein
MIQHQDPFVHILLDGTPIATTKIIYKNRFPQWNENFKFQVDGPIHTIIFDILVVEVTQALLTRFHSCLLCAAQYNRDLVALMK